MQPYNGPVRYNDVNSYLDWCDEAGWEMRGHTLLWGSKSYSDYHPLQKWVKDLPNADIEDTCKVRVQREMSYYKGRIKEYDVMNEAIPYHANYLQRTIGDSINWNCYKWAREIDPDARLFINDYNIITGANDQYKYMTLIQEILDNGGDLDGIGVQSHFGGSISTSTMRSVLDTLASFGLSIKITEFDMDVDQNNISEAQQAKDYAWAMRTAFAHPAVDGFLFWGFWDSRHWRDGAGLFNEDKTPKIAADSVYSLIHEKWHTEGLEENCTALDLNAYYGTYEISVTYQGETRVQYIDLSQIKKGDTLEVKLSDGIYPSPQLNDASVESAKQVKLVFDQEVTLDAVTNQSFILYGDAKYSLTDIKLDDANHKVVYLTTSATIDVGERLFMTYDPKFSSIIGDHDMTLEYIAHLELENNIPSSLYNHNANLDISLYYSQGRITINNNSDLDAFDLISLKGTSVLSGTLTPQSQNIVSTIQTPGIYMMRMRNVKTQEYYIKKIIIN